MKKKISKLQLKKTVITVMNNSTANNMAEAFGTQPLVSCRVVCIASINCPTTIVRQ